MPIPDGRGELSSLRKQLRHQQQAHREVQTMLKNQALAIETFQSKWQLAGQKTHACITRTRASQRTLHEQNLPLFSNLKIVFSVNMMVNYDHMFTRRDLLIKHSKGHACKVLTQASKHTDTYAMCDTCKMKTLSACKAEFKQYKALHSSHTFAFHSDVNERLEHEVINAHITNKSGKSMHKLQAITNLESEALSSKFMHVCSQTLGKEYQLSGERASAHSRV